MIDYLKSRFLLYGLFYRIKIFRFVEITFSKYFEDHIVILSIQKTKTQNHAIKLNKYAKAILKNTKGQSMNRYL